MYNLKRLKTEVLARNIIRYEKTDSTQKEMKRKIEANNIQNGTLIIADIQTDGVGTHGRKWYESYGGNIIFSLAIDLNINVDKIKNLTREIAEIIVCVFEKLYKIKLNIKSPNDIIYNNKKIGGILTETKLNKEKVKYVVIGVGINTNKIEFEDEIKDVATSITKEFGIEVDNDDVIAEFCNKLERLLINNNIIL